MEYKKYQHVETLGTSQTEGILRGDVYVFPKLDGTNAHIWKENGVVRYGSRNNFLSTEADNQGFVAEASKHVYFWDELLEEGEHVYGEFLVAHTYRNYQKDAWRKIYIFDFCVPVTVPNQATPLGVLPEGLDSGETIVGLKHLDFPTWYARFAKVRNKFSAKSLFPESMDNIRVIHPFNADGTISDLIDIKPTFINPTVEQVLSLVSTNTYLCETGTGEGVVIKNYNYVNKYHRTIWAKVVAHKTASVKTRSSRVTKTYEEMVSTYWSRAEVDKIIARIVLEKGEFTQKDIGRLLSTATFEFISDNMYNIFKKFKKPTIDFPQLERAIIDRTKDLVPEFFGV